MIVSTTILSEYIPDIRLVRKIVNRATHQITKMGKNTRGDVCSYTHFDLNEWIEMQEKYIPTARKDFKKDAEMLLEVAKEAREDMR